MRTFSLTLLTAYVALATAPALAADSTTQSLTYLVDGAQSVVKDASGECWRTGEWTPAMATAPCDVVLQPVAVAIVAVEAAPAPVSVPMVAEPVVVIVPVPVMQKISFSGDALFGFDKSVLRPESLALLDDLVQKLNGTNSDKVTVSGHTDRIGSHAYNQKLSEQRAQAVKDYLVSKNLQATSIEARSVGETQPQTTDCVGHKATAKLIACLQPDRRVDVEMTGTRTVLAAP